MKTVRRTVDPGAYLEVRDDITDDYDSVRNYHPGCCKRNSRYETLIHPARSAVRAIPLPTGGIGENISRTRRRLRFGQSLLLGNSRCRVCLCGSTFSVITVPVRAMASQRRERKKRRATTRNQVAAGRAQDPSRHIIDEAGPIFPILPQGAQTPRETGTPPLSWASSRPR